MALFKFTRAILNGEPIDVYNHGEMSRDFTYIDDLVDGMRLLIDAVPENWEKANQGYNTHESISPVAPFRVLNIGNSKPEKLNDFIEAIENSLGIDAVKNFLPMQAGDVHNTWADTSLLRCLTGYHPKTDLVDGIQSFVQWYRSYYNV